MRILLGARIAKDAVTQMVLGKAALVSVLLTARKVVLVTGATVIAIERVAEKTIQEKQPRRIVRTPR